MSSYIPVIGLEVHAELLNQRFSVPVMQNSAETLIHAAALSAQVCPELCR